MKDGIIRGKQAHAYDKRLFSSKKNNQFNSFLNRNVKEGKVLADFCCGGGVSVKFLKDRVKKLYAIDASQEMINLCKKRFGKDKKVELIKGDIANTSLKSDSCDYVLIRMSLHHIKNKEKVLKEVYRVLKKDGAFLIMDKFSKYNLLITYGFDIIRNAIRGHGLFGHYFISMNKFRKMIKNKFEIVDEYSHRKQVYLRANLVLKKI